MDKSKRIERLDRISDSIKEVPGDDYAWTDQIPDQIDSDDRDYIEGRFRIRQWLNNSCDKEALMASLAKVNACFVSTNGFARELLPKWITDVGNLSDYCYNVRRMLRV